jgi:hypothetical protein
VVELLFEAFIGQKLKSAALIGQQQVKHERKPKEQKILLSNIFVINFFIIKTGKHANCSKSVFLTFTF